jgi:hypothetical protein
MCDHDATTEEKITIFFALLFFSAEHMYIQWISINKNVVRALCFTVGVKTLNSWHLGISVLEWQSFSRSKICSPRCQEDSRGRHLPNKAAIFLWRLGFWIT